MHKRNLIAIILTVIIFIAAAILGVTSVYRVSAVTLDVSVISEAARTEADELQKKLLQRYEKENIFSVAREVAEEEFTAFPYFRMTSFKKVYPNRLVITAAEDPEVFAVEKKDGGYYILGSDGTILEERADASNRSDGSDNVLVKGVSAQGVRGQKLEGDASISYLVKFCSTVSLLLDGIRSNLASAEIVKPTSSEKDVRFALKMREGVSVDIYNPMNLTEKKASAFVSLYLSLGDDEKLGGRIAVTDDGKNPDEVLVSYSKNV